MQRTWTYPARGRGVALHDGSNWLPGQITLNALTVAPPCRRNTKLPAPQSPLKPVTLQKLKSRYGKARIADQLKYYRDKRKDAWRDRKRLSGYVTWSLDCALFLAVAGAVLVVTRTGDWVLSIAGLDYLLGLLGTSLPLIAILMQIAEFLSGTEPPLYARYSQQIEFLKGARMRLKAATTEEKALVIVREVEQALLAETVEWSYLAEHAEPVLPPQENSRTSAAPKASAETPNWQHRVWSGLGTGMYLLCLCGIPAASHRCCFRSGHRGMDFLLGTGQLCGAKPARVW